MPNISESRSSLTGGQNFKHNDDQANKQFRDWNWLSGAALGVEQMKMRCPHCGVSGSVDDAYMGKTLSCPKCSTKFQAVPDMVLDSQAETQVTPGAELEQPQREDVRQETTADLPEEDLGKEEPLTADDPVAGKTADPDAAAAEKKPRAGKIEEDPSQAGEYPVVPESKRPPVQSRLEKDEKKEIPKSAEAEAGLPVIGSIKEAFRQTSGVKGQIWLAVFVNSLILLAIDGVARGLDWLVPDGNISLVVMIIGQICYIGLSTIFTAGLLYMGVKRLKGEEIRWQDLFSGFEVAGKILVTWLISVILVVIGYILLILPGIYLTVGYALALPLVIDKKMSPWQALETSRKAIHKVWWRFFGLMLLLSLITVIASIPLLIGLIWVVPMSLLLFGVVYKTIIPKEIVAD